MTKLESSFSRRRELIIVEAEITGPLGATTRRLVFDTGSEATTLTPEVVEEIGYSPSDGHKPSKVHSAIDFRDVARADRAPCESALRLRGGERPRMVVPRIARPEEADP